MQTAFAGCGVIGRSRGRYREVFVSRGGASLQLDSRRALGWGASPVDEDGVWHLHHCTLPVPVR